MLEMIFMILVMTVGFRILRFAVRMSWGVLSVILSIVFLPLMLVFGLLGGLLKLLLPALIIWGVLSLLSPRRDEL